MKPQDRPIAARFAAIIAPLAVSLRADIDEPTIMMYFRALSDVPMQLLEAAAVELAATAKFFPKPAEWREAVDEILDRRERMKALDKSEQALLPGEIGEYECPDCGNTGFVVEAVRCDKGLRCRVKTAEHTHDLARRCEQKYCQRYRQQKLDNAKRYARSRE
jgi:hypothetical protein